MEPARDEHVAAAREEAARHQHGFGRRRRAVVHARVRDVETEQQRGERLELEDRLQRALTDLGLVWRVRGRELGAQEHVVHDARRPVRVGSRAEKDGALVRRLVPCRDRVHRRAQRRLVQTRRQVDVCALPEVRGHVRDEIVERPHADAREHRRDVAGRVRRVRAHPRSDSTCER
jgi:hypothetical protein